MLRTCHYFPIISEFRSSLVHSIHVNNKCLCQTLFIQYRSKCLFNKVQIISHTCSEAQWSTANAGKWMGTYESSRPSFHCACVTKAVTFSAHSYCLNLPQLPFYFRPILFCYILSKQALCLKIHQKTAPFPTLTLIWTNSCFEDGGATCGMRGEQVIIRRCR